MRTDQVERLRSEYVGRSVRVVCDRREYARFANRTGTVKAINCNGRALVQFAGNDAAWYDIPLDFVEFVDSLADEPTNVDQQPVTVANGSRHGMSRLEEARLRKGKTHPRGSE